MSERNYWVFDDDNCKFESMTKEQIYDAIAEATGSTPTPVDEAFITQIKEQNAQHSLKMWKGTEAQFNALEETDPDTIYIIGTNKVKDIDDIEEAISDLQEEVQPVNRGGTGATTAEDAVDNLGIADYIVGTGTSNGYTYWKWASGRLEAEYVWERSAQIKIGTPTSVSGVLASGFFNLPSIPIATSGKIEAVFCGNLSAYAETCWLERPAEFAARLCKLTSSSVTLNGIVITLRLINGRWK